MTPLARFLRDHRLNPDDFKLVIQARSREHREELVDPIEAEMGPVRGVELNRHVTPMSGNAAEVPFTLA
ncbi:hypothetical protein [Terrihabitans rhizophilus]|uniref:Uncharacterized protein n=1 Tax=Terrihabitans rhizophilus TaxID=3092662 RepID=A0ABU4RQ04_9HYPH|nr:hypothetical protein [Terrihabitans sp. PJ23]MDX6806929.1 hypothetical protein [Terrihabitans sp. PJ23]